MSPPAPIFQSLADAHPAVALYRGDLAKVQNSLGGLLDNPSDPEPALKAYEAARANFQALVDDETPGRNTDGISRSPSPPSARSYAKPVGSTRL